MDHPVVGDLHHHLEILVWERRMAEALLGMVVLIAAGIIGYLGFTQNRVGANVRLAGQDISFKQRAEVGAIIKESTEDYRLTLVFPGREVRVSAEELGVTFDEEATLEDVFARPDRGALKRVETVYQELSAGRDFSYKYVLNEEKLENFLVAFAAEQNSTAANADVIVEDGVLKVVPDSPGITVTHDVLKLELKKSLAAATKSLSVPHQRRAAQVNAREAEEARVKASEYLDRKVTFKVGDEVYEPSAAEVARWIVFDVQLLGGDYKLVPSIDRTGIGVYLVSVVGAKHNDAYREVNTELATQRAADTLSAGRDFAGEVPFISVLSRPPAAWDKYIEINLSKQWIWGIRNGRVEIESGISSGARIYRTPTGVFTINRRLRFRDMTIPRVPHVQYFTNVGHAIHGAYWHNEFGPTWRGNYGRSHGCINLPLDVAARMWDWTGGTGTPVWIHY